MVTGFIQLHPGFKAKWYYRCYGTVYIFFAEVSFRMAGNIPMCFTVEGIGSMNPEGQRQTVIGI